MPTLQLGHAEMGDLQHPDAERNTDILALIFGRPLACQRCFRPVAMDCAARTKALESILGGMQPGSHRDRIGEAMRISSRPLDDDQLADRTGISPRQRVNQICRELEHAGLVRRRSGPRGKIVNEWLGSPTTSRMSHQAPPVLTFPR